METYSVLLRLQRTTVEYAYVSVPVTADLIVEQEDSTGRLDTTRLFQEGIQLGTAADVKWYQESQNIKLHPIQQPPAPEERDLPL